MLSNDKSNSYFTGMTNEGMDLMKIEGQCISRKWMRISRAMFVSLSFSKWFNCLKKCRLYFVSPVQNPSQN